MTATVSLHGFRVLPIGKLTRGLETALRHLQAKGFADDTCVVVKTDPGPGSGISHAGGRYVHPGNPHAAEVIHMMRSAGMDPPPPPFVVTPGAITLYHEWGHHVDRAWSGPEQEIKLSFRLLSGFYHLRPLGQVERPRDWVHLPKPAPAGRSPDHATASVAWDRISSELFADLFEDWVRGDRRVSWDHCEPSSVDTDRLLGLAGVAVELLAGVTVEDVRTVTYELLAGGLSSPPALPPVREGFLGPSTERTLEAFRDAVRQVRAIAQRSHTHRQRGG